MLNDNSPESIRTRETPKMPGHSAFRQQSSFNDKRGSIQNRGANQALDPSTHQAKTNSGVDFVVYTGVPVRGQNTTRLLMLFKDSDGSITESSESEESSGAALLDSGSNITSAERWAESIWHQRRKSRKSSKQSYPSRPVSSKMDRTFGSIKFV